MRLGSIFPEANAALAAISCKSTQVLSTNLPPNVPNGVRFAATMKIPGINRTLINYNGNQNSKIFKYSQLFLPVFSVPLVSDAIFSTQQI